MKPSGSRRAAPRFAALRPDRQIVARARHSNHEAFCARTRCLAVVARSDGRRCHAPGEVATSALPDSSRARRLLRHRGIHLQQRPGHPARSARLAVLGTAHQQPIGASELPRLASHEQGAHVPARANRKAGPSPAATRRRRSVGFARLQREDHPGRRLPEDTGWDPSAPPSRDHPRPHRRPASAAVEVGPPNLAGR